MKFYFYVVAIRYYVEADGERRKLGLTSRVMFLNQSHTELDYQFNSTLRLPGQNQERCIMLNAKLKVNHINLTITWIYWGVYSDSVCIK